MLRVGQQSGSHEDFMSEAQLFLASDGEDSLLSEGDEDDTPLSLPTSFRDRRRPGSPPHLHDMNDRAWTIAFSITVAVTVLSALYFRGTAFAVVGHMLKSRGWDLSVSDGGGERMFMVFLLVPLAIAASSSILHVLANWSKLILQTALIASGFVSVTVVCLLCHFGVVRGAVALAVACAVITHFLFVRRGRIKFAAANLKVAALAVQAIPQITSWALFMIVVRVVWLAMCGVALLGSVVSFQTVLAADGTTYRAVDCRSGIPQITTGRSCECSGNIVSDDAWCEFSDPNLTLMCLWSMSVLWGTAVTVTIVDATLAESVASCWPSPGRAEPVWKSFDRVVHSSPGSLCKAAAFFGLVQPVQLVVNRLFKTVRAVSCPLVCVRCVVRYVLEQTAYFVHMFHVTFSEAARLVGTNFRTHGISSFRAETMVVVGVCGSVLTMAVTTMAVFGIPGRVASSLALTGPPDLTATIVYGASVFTVVTTLELVVCAFKAVFECFVKDPEAFAGNHERNLQDDMYKSWQELQPPHSAAGQAHGGVHA